MRGLGDVRETEVVRRSERAGEGSGLDSIALVDRIHGGGPVLWSQLAVGEGGADGVEECREAALDGSVLLGGMGRRFRDGRALIPEAVEQTLVLQLYGIVQMVSFQFAADSDLETMNLASHGLSSPILVAQRFASHEPTAGSTRSWKQWFP